MPESAAGRAGSSRVFGNTVSLKLDMKYIDMSTLVARGGLVTGDGTWSSIDVSIALISPG